jgi:hypothetical protein
VRRSGRLRLEGFQRFGANVRIELREPGGAWAALLRADGKPLPRGPFPYWTGTGPEGLRVVEGRSRLAVLAGDELVLERDIDVGPDELVVVTP